MNTPTEAPHRAWQNLSDEQREIAADLAARALRMWEEADGEISLREAVDLAAVQVGHRPLEGTP